MDTSNLNALVNSPVNAALPPSGSLRDVSHHSTKDVSVFKRHLEATQAGLSSIEDEMGPAVRALPASGGASAMEEDEVLTGYARKWVSQTFFGTLLKQMRESPFKSDLFSGGRGGEAFGGMYDQHLADRMARGAGRQLAESIVRQIKQRQTVGTVRKSADRSAGSLSIAA